MNKTIHLDTLEGIPGKYLKKLQRYREAFKSNLYLDGLLDEEQDIRDTVMEIDGYCMDHYIKGYHYTRAIVDDIRTQGLLCRSGEEIRARFTANHSTLFTDQEWGTIQKCWTQYFDTVQQSSRDQRIFFNTTTTALHNGGAGPLFDHFGGEQIHMPLNGHDGIMRKLSQIGMTITVVFRFRGTQATGIGKLNPWGHTAVSTYHRMINPEAYIHDVDAYVSEAVTPDRIIEIRLMQGIGPASV